MPAEKWHTVDTAFTALNTETAPIMQPLTTAERNALLGVGSVKESFTRDCLALMTVHPELVPASLGAADAAREGHNLQFADEIIFFALPWSPPDIQQWIGRIELVRNGL